MPWARGEPLHKAVHELLLAGKMFVNTALCVCCRLLLSALLFVVRKGEHSAAGLPAVTCASCSSCCMTLLLACLILVQFSLVHTIVAFPGDLLTEAHTWWRLETWHAIVDRWQSGALQGQGLCLASATLTC